VEPGELIEKTSSKTRYTKEEESGKEGRGKGCGRKENKGVRSGSQAIAMHLLTIVVITITIHLGVKQGQEAA
jgi:hypothetical protein